MKENKMKNNPNDNYAMYEQDRVAKRKAQTASGAPEAPHHKFPLKPYLSLARTVFEDAQGSNDMGVIADLLEVKATAAKLAEALRWLADDCDKGEEVDTEHARRRLAQWEAGQ